MADRTLGNISGSIVSFGDESESIRGGCNILFVEEDFGALREQRELVDFFVENDVQALIGLSFDEGFLKLATALGLICLTVEKGTDYDTIKLTAGEFPSNSCDIDLEHMKITVNIPGENAMVSCKQVA